MTAVRGRVLTPAGVLVEAVVRVTGSTIERVDVVETDPPTATGQLILPGLVDIHCHGGGGATFQTAEPEDVEKAAAHHLAHGTTTVVASVVTDATATMIEAISCLADAVDRGTVAAIHLEGPFLSAQRCGAQDPAHLRSPDVGLARELLDAGRGHVAMMTIAPELPGADDVLELCHLRRVRVAMGHTSADGATVRSAVTRAGEPVFTHLFNGMPPIHHRDPGPAMAALVAGRAGQAYLELIADGTHLSDEMVSAVFALVGGDRVALVTDAMAAAGMPDGDFVLGPQRVSVRDGVATLTDGDSLAGGTSRLLDIVRRQVDAGLRLGSVVRAASQTPADVLRRGTNVGGLVPGRRADLVVTDAGLVPQRVMRAGEWVG